MKSILLHIHEDEGQEARFSVACDLARAFDGHLTCVQVTPLSAYVAADPFGGFYPIAGLYEYLNEQNRIIRSRLEKRLAQEKLQWDWQDCDGDVAQTLVSQSRLADLVVLSQSGVGQHDGARPLPLVADVAINTRAPVLAVPANVTAFDPGGTAIVAWNGSSVATPKAPLNPAMPAASPFNGTPLLYARLDPDGLGISVGEERRA